MNEEDEKGLWDARSGLRTGLGLGFEVGANTLLDIFSFIPPAQVAGGTFINYLAQKIRGGEISKGELTAAGLTSLIPGGTQARAVTRGGRLARNVAKGGLSGGITTTSMSLIDEGELPSFGEFAGGVGLGGAFGGAFDLAPAAFTGRLGTEVSEIAGDTGFFLKQLRRKVQGGDLIFDPEIYYGPGFGAGTVGAAKPDKNLSGQGFTNITKKNLKLFNKVGWTGTAKLDIQEMLYGVDEVGKPLLSNYQRRLMKAGIAEPAFDFKHFKEHRGEIVKEFLDGLQDLNIDPKTIHAHHVSGLRVTSALFDGLSPIQRKNLTKTFLEEGLALGNDPKNLIALHSSSHLGVLHPFLESQIGKYGQLLIDPAKIKNMSVKNRKVIVREFANIIKESERIALEHSRKWLDEMFTNLSPEAAFQAKWDMLQQAFENELTLRKLLIEGITQPKIFSKNVRFNKQLKQLQKELFKGDIDSPEQLSIWNIDEESLDIWSSLLKDLNKTQPEAVQEIMKKLNFDPKQLELNFERQLDLDLGTD